jgi:F420-0:gamma-glutamyl ligase
MFGKVDLFGKPKFGGIDLIAHELTAASALVFGQVNAGIPVAVVRGYEYQINETENISNTLWPATTYENMTKAMKDTMQATALQKTSNVAVS